MRVEPFGVGSYVHVVKRGARGLDIVRDESDKWRFLRMLFLLNDSNFDKDGFRTFFNKPLFYRPDTWPERKPLLEIYAYTLMTNHFHLLLREVEEGGVSSFMQKLGQSMTNHSNEKYDESGSLFQGSYRSRTVDSDEYLQHVAAYIMLKNTFELYPGGGLDTAKKDFDTVWEWGVEYKFSSLGDYAGVRKNSPVLADTLCENIFTSSGKPDEFRTFARNLVEGGQWSKEVFFE